MWIFGVISSLPMLTCVAVVPSWLTDLHLPKWHMAIIAWSTLPYSLKLFLGPVVHMTSFGLVGRRWGHYRVWIVFLCTLLALAFGSIGWIDPTHSWTTMYALLGAVGLLGALLDCVLEGYRICATPLDRQDGVAGFNAKGYRLGGWLYTSGALWVASYQGWQWSFRTVAFVIAVLGWVGVISLPQPNRWREDFSWQQYGRLLKQGYDFFQNHFYFTWVLGMILAQKLGEGLVRSLWHPFLISMGIDKVSIIHIDKGYGLVASMVGIQWGVWLIARYTMRHTLRIWVLLQCLLMGMLALLATYRLHALWFDHLFLTTTLLHHLVGGLGHVSILAYVSRVAKGGSSMDDLHHAMLTSVGAFGRTVVSWGAASVASGMEWSTYFTCAMLGCIPALLATSKIWPFVRRNFPLE